MKNKFCLALASLVILIIYLASQVSWASTPRPITLEEALNLALEQNTSHALFLWEQELLERKESLSKHPQITVKTDPVSVSDGQVQGPTGSVTMAMPLGDNIDLGGQVTLGLKDQNFSVRPSGSLTLDYRFFSLPERSSGGPSPEEKRQQQVNGLILQTVELLIELRQALDMRNYEEDRLAYLDTMLEAARQTPNYDDLELRKKIRDQVAALASAEERVGLLQLQLSTILGTAETISVEPVFLIQELNVQLDEERLQAELFASHQGLREAKGTLALAQDKLDLERKMRGWDLQARGAISLNPPVESVEPDSVGWSIGLSATKVLYPRETVLEELELAVAQAEYALELKEASLLGELRNAMQGIKAAQDRSRLKAEHLAEVRDDLALRHRQYEAGLVTSLQVEEVALSLRQAELDDLHETMAVARSILALWNLCGRDLNTLVFQVIQ